MEARRRKWMKKHGQDAERLKLNELEIKAIGLSKKAAK